MDETLRIKSVAGEIGRIIAGRLLPGTDMINGLEETCRRHNVKYAFISSIIGALKKVTFAIPTPSNENKVGAVYSDPIVLEGVIEFLGGQGVICQSPDGQYLTHFHGSVSDMEGRVWGGHFLNGGNICVSTVDFVLCEVKDIRFMRRFDEETGFIQFSPEKGEE